MQINQSYVLVRGPQHGCIRKVVVEVCGNEQTLVNVSQLFRLQTARGSIRGTVETLICELAFLRSERKRVMTAACCLPWIHVNNSLHV